MHRFIALTLTLLLSTAQVASAQQLGTPRFGRALSEPERAGVKAANTTSLGAGGALAFVGGMGLGFTFLFLAAGEVSGKPAFAAVGSIALTMAGSRIAVASRNQAIPTHSDSMAIASGEDRQAFQNAYTNRLNQRLRNRWLLGFGTGFVGLLGAAAVAFSNYD